MKKLKSRKVNSMQAIFFFAIEWVIMVPQLFLCCQSWLRMCSDLLNVFPVYNNTVNLNTGIHSKWWQAWQDSSLGQGLAGGRWINVYLGHPDLLTEELWLFSHFLDRWHECVLWRLVTMTKQESNSIMLCKGFSVQVRTSCAVSQENIHQN